jgi:hypothetical protein
MMRADMSSDPKDQKTAILQEAPPEVAAAAQKALSGGNASGMASGLPPPPAPPPGGAPPTGGDASAKTMMLDGGMPRPVIPTSTPAPARPTGERVTGGLPPVRKPKRESTWGRWLAGPVIAAVVAAGTFALAGVVMPIKPPGLPPPKPQGRLKLISDPPGASIMLDGKVFPHFTPYVIEGDVGATLHVEFKLDGYKLRAADVSILDGEHQFGAKLERAEAPAPPPPEPVVAPPPPVKEHHHHSSSTPKEPAGKATISVFVRPWAIVYVDGTRLRQTPVQAFELPSGKHTIELVNEGKNRREKIPLDLKAGATEEIRRDWDK